MISDKDIKKLIEKNPTLIDPWPDTFKGLEFSNEVWGKQESPIQPSSLDLHVGNIYIPGRKVGEPGSHGNGETSYLLEQGQSVIVSTNEKLDLPNDIGGIVFPPSGLSSGAILVSNIGHIDPGYKGPLRFTLINMGTDTYALEQSNVIGTLMLFKTSSACTSPWNKRSNIEGKLEPDQKEIDALSPDFMNFTERANDIAKSEIKKRLIWGKIITSGVAIVLTIITFLLSAYLANYDGRINKLDDKIEKIKEIGRDKEITHLKKQINDLNIKINSLNK